MVDTDHIKMQPIVSCSEQGSISEPQNFLGTVLTIDVEVLSTHWVNVIRNFCLEKMWCVQTSKVWQETPPAMKPVKVMHYTLHAEWKSDDADVYS